MVAALIGDASAQDAIDLLDVARRAAAVDEALSSHERQLRAVDPKLGRRSPRVRGAWALSYYWVPDLALPTVSGSDSATLDRSYMGFVLDVLPKAPAVPGLDPIADLRASQPIVSLSGGGLAYGLQRPFHLPGPADPEILEPFGDRVGTQYSDEQYTMLARWRGWRADGSWLHSEQVDAGDGGRIVASTREVRVDRIQGRLATPVGVETRVRTDDRGVLEDFTVGWTVNDTVDTVRAAPPSTWAPRLQIGFRRSDYGADDPRSHPRALSMDVVEDLSAWLPQPAGSDPPAITAAIRADAEVDVARALPQLGLVEATARVTHAWYELGVEGGVSGFQEPALVERIGRAFVPGARAAVDLTLPIYAGTAFHFSYTYRSSWAEEIRTILEFAGTVQHRVLVQLAVAR